MNTSSLHPEASSTVVAVTRGTDQDKQDMSHHQKNVWDHSSHHHHHHNSSNNDSHNQLINRTSSLLTNKSFTDVTFIVGPPSHSKKYVGHRVLLAMTSPVFEAMFYGDLSDKSTSGGNKVIRIPDLAPIGFENLLRYAYTDSLNLSSVEDAMLTAYAAKKYLLPHLLKECTAFVEKNVSPSSACSVLEFASLLHSSALLFQAIQVIDRQTYQVLSHKSINGVQASTLALLVSRRYLNVYSEASLVSACLQWAGSEARRRGLDSSDYSILRFLLEEAGILRHLRFLALTPEEFTRIVASTGGISGKNQQQTSLLSIKSNMNEEDTDGIKETSSSTGGSLLTKTEVIATFMNLSIPGIRSMTKGLSSESKPRAPPPDFFVVQNRKTLSSSRNSAIAAPLNSVSPAAKIVRSAGVKFQVPSFDVFIVGASFNLRLDPGFYSIKSPKIDLSLRFNSRPGIPSEDSSISLTDSSSMNVFEEDSRLTVVLSKDKDAVIRFKRPLLAKKGTLNEIILSFIESSSSSDGLIVIKSAATVSKSSRSLGGNQSEVVDSEGIDWLFFKPNSGIDFSEVFYYF